jgi:hypothetical protein
LVVEDNDDTDDPDRGYWHPASDDRETRTLSVGLPSRHATPLGTGRGQATATDRATGTTVACRDDPSARLASRSGGHLRGGPIGGAQRSDCSHLNPTRGYPLTTGVLATRHNHQAITTGQAKSGKIIAGAALIMRWSSDHSYSAATASCRSLSIEATDDPADPPQADELPRHPLATSSRPSRPSARSRAIHLRAVRSLIPALQTEPGVSVHLHPVSSLGLTGLSTCQPPRSTGWLTPQTGTTWSGTTSRPKPREATPPGRSRSDQKQVAETSGREHHGARHPDPLFW